MNLKLSKLNPLRLFRSISFSDHCPALQTKLKFSFCDKISNLSSKVEGMMESKAGKAIRELKKQLSTSNMTPFSKAYLITNDLKASVEYLTTEDLLKNFNESEIVMIMKIKLDQKHHNLQEMIAWLISEYRWIHFEYLEIFLIELNEFLSKSTSLKAKDFKTNFEVDSPLLMLILKTLSNCEIQNWTLFCQMLKAISRMNFKKRTLWNEIINTVVIFNRKFSEDEISSVIETITSLSVGNYYLLEDFQRIFFERNQEKLFTKENFVKCYIGIFTRHELSGLTTSHPNYDLLRGWILNFLPHMDNFELNRVYYSFAFNNLNDPDLILKSKSLIFNKKVLKMPIKSIQSLAWSNAVLGFTDENEWNKILIHLDFASLKNEKKYYIGFCQVLLFLKYNAPNIFNSNSKYEYWLKYFQKILYETESRTFFEGFKGGSIKRFFDLFSFLDSAGIKIVRELPISIYNVDAFFINFDFETFHPDKIDYVDLEGKFMTKYLEKKIVNNPQYVKEAQAMDPRKGLIFEMDGPSHFDFELTCTKGKSILKYKLLKQLGYKFVGMNQLDLEALLRCEDFKAKYTFFYEFLKEKLKEKSN